MSSLFVFVPNVARVWIIHSRFPLRYSLTFSLFCILCTQCCPCLWIIHSRFPLQYSLTFSLFCILCAQCCPCLWIIHSPFPLRYSLMFSLFCILCTLFFQFLRIVHSRFPPLVFSNVYLTLKRNWWRIFLKKIIVCSKLGIYVCIAAWLGSFCNRHLFTASGCLFGILKLFLYDIYVVFKVVPYTSGKICSALLIFLFFWQCVWIYPLQ